ncbi:DUF4395 domain-containing protein [Hydrogenovibrio thermophilus]|uniref:DUF4395 domain-containing protein n=1 Tax=Hydrogenovibrio thermophilus TaxID=265883 RepID=A0A451G451_9GAMM|nr:DUF4395 domain-containing protein [Hydrogenovibrio thermophilus]QAB14236.1 DUF4395 domain-containing protein [Hydrogenovibrio thermophilus]
MHSVFKNLWFRDPKEKPTFINDNAVKIRAGMLLIIPIYMTYTLIDVVFGSSWSVMENTTMIDTLETDWNWHTIYQVQATQRVYDYTIQTWVLFYGLFEMIAGMFVTTSRLSPTIYIASFLAKTQKPNWKPLVPKRFAWTIGASFITVCLIFFNPDVFANWVNAIFSSKLLPTTENYMSNWIPLILVWVCFGFMWLEAILGFCVGCKVHALLVKVGIFKEECEACNNIDWDEIARKHAERQAQEAAQGNS